MFVCILYMIHSISLTLSDSHSVLISYIVCSTYFIIFKLRQKREWHWRGIEKRYGNFTISHVTLVVVNSHPNAKKFLTHSEIVWQPTIFPLWRSKNCVINGEINAMTNCKCVHKYKRFMAIKYIYMFCVDSCAMVTWAIFRLATSGNFH